MKQLWQIEFGLAHLECRLIRTINAIEMGNEIIC